MEKIEKAAEEIKKGDIIQPFINEFTLTRVNTEFVVIEDAEYMEDPSWSHMVSIKCLDKNGEPDEIIIGGGEIIVVIDRNK